MPKPNCCEEVIADYCHYHVDKRDARIALLESILRAWLDWRANKSTEDLDAIAERAEKAVEG
jgi:hypothetical protein